MDKDILLQMIEDDEDGLLKVTPKSRPASSDSILQESFNEINEFISSTWNKPDKNNWIQERKLATRLEEIQKSENKVKQLEKYDIHHILPEVISTTKTIEDIFADDDLWILDDTSDIFNLKFVKPIDRTSPDYIARRKPCPNFDDYKDKFIKCHEEINKWEREVNFFVTEESLQPKMFYILDGVMLYINSIWKTHIDKNHKKDGRLHCIFENGTESTMLLRSLWKAMRANQWWRVISQPLEDSINRLKWITADDEASGYIYVLKYKWKNSEIQNIKDLYKVWFSVNEPEDRIKNSINEPTYLMAPVYLSMKAKCYNMNPQKFEKAIHTLLWSYQVNLDIFDNEWKRHSPREWFSVWIDVIEQAIDVLVSTNQK